MKNNQERKDKKMYTIKKDSQVILLNKSCTAIDEFISYDDKTFNETWLVEEAVCTSTDCPCDREPFLIFQFTEDSYIQTFKSNVVVS